MKWIIIVSVSVFIYCAVLLSLILIGRNKIAVQERLIRLGTAEKEQKHEKNPKNKLKLNYVYVSESLAREIYSTNLKIKPEEFVLIWVLSTIAPTFLFYIFTGSLIRSIAVSLIGAAVPIIYLKSASNKQQKNFEKQLGDSLQVLANALRSGFSFPQALESLSKDMPEPLGSEFRTAGRELQMGMDMEEVLLKIAGRMKSDDMRLLTAAVLIQQQVGGNLAEILDSISQTIRDRLAIRRSVRTLTAQGRISGQIVGLIPVFLLIVISVISPNYTEVFFTTSYGYLMLGLCVVLECLGFLVIFKIVNIKF